MKTDNELIAEFMGWKMIATRNSDYWERPGDSAVNWQAIDRFSTSWDWLMPVVEKIQTEYSLVCGIEESARDRWGMYSGITIYGETWRSFYWSGYSDLITLLEEEKRKGNPNPTEFRMLCSSKIEAVYKAVIEFIKWHNHQKGK